MAEAKTDQKQRIRIRLKAYDHKVIDQSTRTSAIIAGIAQITQALRIELVAEGIETENQLTQMRAFGINAIQGYLYSKPLPVTQLRRVISEPLAPGLAKSKRIAVVDGDRTRRAS